MKKAYHLKINYVQNFLLNKITVIIIVEIQNK